MAANRGVWCTTSERSGFIRVLTSFDSLLVDGRLDDSVSLLGPPVLHEPPCDQYMPASCVALCDGDDDCNHDGACVTPPAPLAGASVEVVRASGTTVVTVDEVYGTLSATLPLGPADEVFTLRVLIPGEPTVTFSSSMPTLLSEPITGSDPNHNGGSGPVTFSWTPGGDDSVMHLTLRPNHHAPIGFAECVVADDVGTVTASAAMIEPLRRVTGFEGGQGTRMFVGSAELSMGCVELAVGSQSYINITP